MNFADYDHDGQATEFFLQRNRYLVGSVQVLWWACLASMSIFRSVGPSGFVSLNRTSLGEPIPTEARRPQPSAGHLRILLSRLRILLSRRGPGTHDSHTIPDGRALPTHAQPSFDIRYAVPARRRHPGRVYLASPGVAVDRLVPAALRSDVLRSMPTPSCDSAY